MPNTTPWLANRSQFWRRRRSKLAVIVKLRGDGAGAAIAKLANGADRTAALAKRTGLALSLKREISDLDGREHGRARRLELQRRCSSVCARTRRSNSFPSITGAFAHATTPNDALFANQWYLQNTEISAVNAIDAWDRELGSAGVVIAVLDTGVLYDHPDLGRGDRGGKLLPGYDFVSADAHGQRRRWARRGPVRSGRLGQ